MDQSFISGYYECPRIITPNDGAHYFFGYYDMRASQGRRHLAHRVPFMDRLPEKGDVAELGFLEEGRFTPFATTTAWNFQQGAMLQYHPFQKDTVYYNIFLDGRERTVTHNYVTGEKTYTDRATACISPDGRWGMAVNFARIFAFRPGYGYAESVDPHPELCAPADDGIFLTDMESGASRLLVDYPTMAKLCGYGPESKILINHITFNPASDRYVALVRDFPAPDKANGGWVTCIIIGDLHGNVWLIPSHGYASHYIWQDPRHLIIHSSAACKEKKSMYRIHTEDGSFTELDMPYFHLGGNGDIHCNLSPDGKYVIGDGYPREGYRWIEALNLETGMTRTLLKSRTVRPVNTDVRCDLHNRFVFDGTCISYDTTENGCRQIALVDLAALSF